MAPGARIRSRFRGQRTQLLGEAARQAAMEALARAPDSTPRDYFLALSEYQRRRTDPLAQDGIGAHELRVSSQNGEDGAIQEILRRIGTSDQPFFVEFGIETGSEGNAIVLADACGWGGLFIEADPNGFAALERKYRHTPAVMTRRALVTPENIERLLVASGVSSEPDLFSIDVDGDDYWIWQAITSFRPRLIVIEYNSDFSAQARTVQAPGRGPWRGTSDFGASLDALIGLAGDKGYDFVHTDLAGANAFFVRSDLGITWPAPRRAGTNYYLRSWGHPSSDDPRERVDV